MSIRMHYMTFALETGNSLYFIRCVNVDHRLAVTFWVVGIFKEITLCIWRYFIFFSFFHFIIIIIVLPFSVLLFISMWFVFEHYFYFSFSPQNLYDSLSFFNSTTHSLGLIAIFFFFFFHYSLLSSLISFVHHHIFYW